MIHEAGFKRCAFCSVVVSTSRILRVSRASKASVVVAPIAKVIGIPTSVEHFCFVKEMYIMVAFSKICSRLRQIR